MKGAICAELPRKRRRDRAGFSCAHSGCRCGRRPLGAELPASLPSTPRALPRLLRTPACPETFTRGRASRPHEAAMTESCPDAGPRPYLWLAGRRSPGKSRAAGLWASFALIPHDSAGRPSATSNEAAVWMDEATSKGLWPLHRSPEHLLSSASFKVAFASAFQTSQTILSTSSRRKGRRSVQSR